MKKYVIKTAQKRVINLTQPGEYQVLLTCSGAEAEIKGIFLAQNHDQVNVTIIVHHSAPHTRAQTTLKAVGRDQSRIKLVGRIKIDPDCGQTHSFLTERILLLSDQATAETVPDLEIETDDVKCSHAASISHLPESQLFYLMSRGLDRHLAENLIIGGFLEMGE